MATKVLKRLLGVWNGFLGFGVARRFLYLSIFTVCIQVVHLFCYMCEGRLLSFKIFGFKTSF